MTQKTRQQQIDHRKDMFENNASIAEQIPAIQNRK